MGIDDVNKEPCLSVDTLDAWLGEWPKRWVVAQLGQSLDGRIATPTGHSHYINALSSRVFLHLLRARVDAVLIGVGTAVADLPSLTTRHVDGPSPARVIIDPRARINADNPVFNDDGVEVIHVFDPSHPPPRYGAHVQSMTLPIDDNQDTGFANLPALLDQLAERGLNRILVEGGRTTVSRFMEAELIDRLYFMLAPLLIGSGPAGIELPPIEHLDQATRGQMRSLQWGEELLIEFARS